MLRRISDYFVNGSAVPQSFITKGKQRLKQHTNTVYLKNGDEFEIELFNPTQNKVLAKIELNGKSIGSGIILRPGERVFLERYLDEAKKFLFETYVVNGNNDEVKKAIANNGEVKVSFHNEMVLSGTVTYTNPLTYYPIPYTYTTHNTLGGASTFTTNSTDMFNTSRAIYTSGINTNLFYNQSLEHSEKSFNNFFDTLSKYDLVIIDLHAMTRFAAKNYNVTEETKKFVEALSGRTKVVLCVFGNPYSLKYFEYLPWILEAYEDNDATNLAAANTLFGAEKISGKLPVTACKTFLAGTGFASDTIYRLKISSPEEVGLKTSALAKMDDIIQKGIDNKAFPGCQLLVAKDGRVIWNKCYGIKFYESTERVKAAELYDLASITKVAATTLAVMKLFEQKKIALDKTVGDYLPLPKEATIKNLKLRDVLTHQAGLKAFFMFYKNTIDSNFEKYYRKNFDSVFSIRVADSLFIRNDYPDTMWSIIVHSPVEEHPKYVYSDNDFYILQKIVEHISGKKMDEFVNENFYRPMGLTRIGYKPLNRFVLGRILPTENDSAFRKQVVRGYVHDPGAAMYGGVAGHAGVFSNAFDLAALFQMLLNNGIYNGKRFLDSSTIHTFTARQSKISRRGFGFDKPEPDVSKPSPCYDGVPLSVFGHTGFTGTCVWSDPENNLTYIFLSNRVYPNAENNQLVKMNIRTDLQEVIYKALGK